jgi:hypothetical protein
MMRQVSVKRSPPRTMDFVRGASEWLCPSEGFPERGATKMRASKWEASLAANARLLQLAL